MPFERVLELAPVDQLGIKLPTRPGMMVSFLDFRKIPVAELWEQTNFGIYGDNLSHGGINMWINRHAGRTTVTISFPDNPVARKSVHRYIAALSKAFARRRQDHRGLDRRACPPCEFERIVRRVRREPVTEMKGTEEMSEHSRSGRPGIVPG